MTELERLAEWASTLDLSDVPRRVVALARSQVLSQLAAVRAGLSHPHGRRLVAAFGRPWQADVQRSAAVLSGLGSWMHYDDTAYAGHLSNSTVGVPLAYAYRLGLDGRRLLTAVIAANECAARITAAATLGPFRGQMAGHTNLAGAIAGRLHCTGAPGREWVDAFGLAFAMAPWNLTHAYLGSDARILGSLLPVRSALVACDAAAAGARGAADILEHPQGFLARFATVPLPETLTLGLGSRWHTETLSFKMHPSGPGADAAVDCAMALYRSFGPVDVDEVSEVEVHVSRYTMLVELAASAYPSGLLSTTPYPVATALLTGALTPADLVPPATEEPDRVKLAAKTRLVHDESMSRALLTSDAPFGEAIRQAGPRAQEWLAGFGVPAPPPARPRRSFRDSEKVTPAHVIVRLHNGVVRERRVDIPLGAAGPQTRRRHADLVRQKFRDAGGRDRIADAVLRLDELGPAEVRETLRAALRK